MTLDAQPLPRLRPHPQLGWAALRWLPALTVVALAIVLLIANETPLASILAYGGYLLAVIALPGRLVWRWLRSGTSAWRASALEDWTMGAAAGYALELVAYPLARWAGHPRLYIILPLAIALALLLREKRHGRIPVVPMDNVSRWSYAAIVGYLTVWLSAVVFARTSLMRFWPSDADETFHLSLVGELRHHFPPAYPFADAGGLTYQWFVHAHMAASTWVTGVDPLVVYRRFDVLVLSVVAVLGTGVLAMHLSRRSWPGPVAAGLLVLVGSFDLTGAVRGEAAPEERFLEGGLLLNSPTQTLAFALLPAVVLLCIRVLEERRMDARVWGGVLLGTMVLSGTKATTVPVLLAGFAAAAAVTCFRTRSVPWRPLSGVAICVAVLAVTTRFLYGGDSYSLRFDPGETTAFFMTRLGIGGRGAVVIAVVTAALLVMWLVSAVGVVGFVGAGTLRWDPRVWWLLGAGAAGLGATLMLAHAGMSQLYFGRTVAPLLAVLSAWGLAQLFPPGTSRGEVARAALVAVVAGLLVLAVRAFTESLRVQREANGAEVSEPLLRLWLNLPAILLLVVLFAVVRAVVRDVSHGAAVLRGRTLVVLLLGLGLARSFAFVAGHYPEVDVTEGHTAVPPGGLVAASWLRVHSAPEDRVLTNVHCLPAEPDDDVCDSRHFWMSAFSERRFVLEGWAYTRHQEAWTEPYWGPPARLEANDRVFTDPAGSQRFVRESGARWLLVDDEAPADLAELEVAPALRLRFRAGDFSVFQVAR